MTACFNTSKLLNHYPILFYQFTSRSFLSTIRNVSDRFLGNVMNTRTGNFSDQMIKMIKMISWHSWQELRYFTCRNYDPSSWFDGSLKIPSNIDRPIMRPVALSWKNQGIKIIRIFRIPPQFIFSVHAETWTKNRSDEVISRMTPFWWRSDRSRYKNKSPL